MKEQFVNQNFKLEYEINATFKRAYFNLRA